LLQLAAYSDTPIEEISSVLEQGLETKLHLAGNDPNAITTVQLVPGKRIANYGIITNLTTFITRSKLPTALNRRYQFLLADDVDDYQA